MTSTNVLRSPVPCFMSEYAFSEALTREDRTELKRAYRRAGIEPFHYMNAGTLNYSHVSWFVSYYTFIIGATYSEKTEHAYLHVNPFVWDTNPFVNSRTTNKQTNKWLHEHGFNVTVQGLRTCYRLANDGYASSPFYMDDGTLVVPFFNHTQTYLNNDGTRSHERITNDVPRVAYDDAGKTLLNIGRDIIVSDGTHEFVRG